MLRPPSATPKQSLGLGVLKSPAATVMDDSDTEAMAAPQPSTPTLTGLGTGLSRPLNPTPAPKFNPNPLTCAAPLPSPAARKMSRQLTPTTSVNLSVYPTITRVVATYPLVKDLTLPAGINLASLLLYSRNTDGMLTILPSYQVLPHNDSTVYKRGKGHTGRVVADDGHNAELLIDNIRTKINGYDYIEATEETLNLHLPDTTGTNIVATYSLEQITWYATGVLDLSTATITINAVINKNQPFGMCANVTVIATSMPMDNRQPRRYMAARAMMAAPVEDSGYIQDGATGVGNYVSYPLKDVHQIEDAQSQQLRSMPVTIRTMYVYTVNDNKMKFAYFLVAPDYVPHLQLSIVQNPTGLYYGKLPVRQTEAGETIEVTIGPSTLVDCQCVVADSKPTASEVEHYRYTDYEHLLVAQEIALRATNHGTEVATVLVRHYVGRQKVVSSILTLTKPSGEVTSTILEYTMDRNGNIEFKIVDLEPGETRPAESMPAYNIRLLLDTSD